MATQIIRDHDGKPAFAVIPWSDYETLLPSEAEAALTDEELFDAAKADAGETFPASVVDRLLAGQRPLKVFREYRGLTQRALAEVVGCNPVYLSQIERGGRTGSAPTLKKIAKALRVEMSDLVDVGVPAE